MCSKKVEFLSQKKILWKEKEMWFSFEAGWLDDGKI